MSAPEQIISDEDIIRVHGYANFGGMTPREVVNDGVRKYAAGFTGGSTQLAILREHGLVRKPEPGKYRASLTEKGKRYARSIWNTHFCRADLARPQVKPLVWYRVEDQLPEVGQDILLAVPDGEGGYSVRDAALYVRHEGVHPVPSDVLNRPTDFHFASIYPGNTDMRLARPGLLWADMPAPPDARILSALVPAQGVE